MIQKMIYLTMIITLLAGSAFRLPAQAAAPAIEIPGNEVINPGDTAPRVAVQEPMAGNGTCSLPGSGPSGNKETTASDLPPVKKGMQARVEDSGLFAAPLAAPANDLWANSITVPIPSSTAGTTIEATLDGTAVCGGVSNDSPGVWYHVVGDGGIMTAGVCTSYDYDTKISVYLDNGATCVGGNDDYCSLGSQVTWTSTAGTDYYILVHGYGGATGNFTLSISSLIPPANDNCSAATVVDAIPYVNAIDTSVATTAPDDPVMNCTSGQNSNTVWYTYTPANNGLLTASTIGSNYDTVLAIYTGSCGSLTEVACNDDAGGGLQSMIADLPIAAGTTYYIEAADYGNPNGGSLNFSLDVVWINNPPVAVDDDYATDEDVTLVTPAPGVLGNDTDTDGDVLTATLNTGPTIGDLALAIDGSFAYTPTLDFNGEITFTYIVSDGELADTAVVTITVNPINDAPVGIIDEYSTNEDIPLVVAAPGVLGNDTDMDGDVLTATLETGPTIGSLVLGLDGSLTYTPTLDFNGEISFTYIASDGLLTDTAVVTITVNPVNDAPVADDQAIVTDEDTAYSGMLTASDVDSASLDFGLDTAPAHGMVSIALDGSFTYTPTLDYNGPDVFTFTVTDGALTDTGQVTITVTPVNDAPDVDAGEDVNTFEGNLVQFNGGYTDPGRSPQDFTFTWDFGDSMTTTGTLAPSHTYEDDGIYTVTLTVDDGEGGVGVDTLLVTVDNIAPALEPIANQSILVGEVLTLTAAYSDPGVLDTHTALIDWGDGYTETIDLDTGLTGFDFAHAFDAAGAYTVTVTLTDDDDGQNAITFQIIVTPSGYKIFLPTLVKK